MKEIFWCIFVMQVCLHNLQAFPTTTENNDSDQPASSTEVPAVSEIPFPKDSQLHKFLPVGCKNPKLVPPPPDFTKYLEHMQMYSKWYDLWKKWHNYNFSDKPTTQFPSTITTIEDSTTMDPIRDSTSATSSAPSTTEDIEIPSLPAGDEVGDQTQTSHKHVSTESFTSPGPVNTVGGLTDEQTQKPSDVHKESESGESKMPVNNGLADFLKHSVHHGNVNIFMNPSYRISQCDGIKNKDSCHYGCEKHSASNNQIAFAHREPTPCESLHKNITDEMKVLQEIITNIDQHLKSKHKKEEDDESKINDVHTLLEKVKKIVEDDTKQCDANTNSVTTTTKPNLQTDCLENSFVDFKEQEEDASKSETLSNEPVTDEDVLSSQLARNSNEETTKTPDETFADTLVELAVTKSQENDEPTTDLLVELAVTKSQENDERTTEIVKVVNSSTDGALDNYGNPIDDNDDSDDDVKSKPCSKCLAARNPEEKEEITKLFQLLGMGLLDMGHTILNHEETCPVMPHLNGDNTRVYDYPKESE